MTDSEGRAQDFELHRPRLTAVAYRMLGSLAEAEDAVQEAWLRFDAAGTEGVDNVGAWLTTIVTRQCLNALRTRTHRREDPLEVYVPDPIVSSADSADPEREALLADAVGVALDVVLDSLQPAERVAFVLHDLFDVPFDGIAATLNRTPAATRQLASRARRRVRGESPGDDPDPVRNREVVDAFFAAARSGDLQQLIAVLDPEVVLRADGSTTLAAATAVVHGAEAVARRAVLFSNPLAVLVPALVNGGTGVVVLVDGRCTAVLGFAVRGGHIAGITALADPDRLATLDLSGLRL